MIQPKSAHNAISHNNRHFGSFPILTRKGDDLRAEVKALELESIHAIFAMQAFFTT